MNDDTLTTNEFIIQSIPWKVREIPGGDPRIDDLCGKADFANKTIWLCMEMPYQERIETLVHECLHVCTAGWQRADLLQEDTLRIVSMMLVDTLIRNCIIAVE